MTPTLLFWIKIAIGGVLVWAIWTIFRMVKKQKKIIPVTTDEWKRLLPEVMFVGLGIFFFVWLEKNFQQQIDAVIKEKDKPLQGLFFTNMKTGARDSLAAYKGKTVILNLWATWCDPCRRELPSLEKLNAEYNNEVVVLALSDENSTAINKFRSEKDLSLLIGAYDHYPLLDSLSSRPVSILIDKDNKVKDVVVGAREYSFFKKWIKPYIQQPE